MRLFALAAAPLLAAAAAFVPLSAQVRPTPRRPVPPAPQPTPKPTPAPALTPVPQLAPPLARVAGEVYDSVAMKPLAGATVQFVSAKDPAKVRSATTDERGMYAVDSLPTGLYLVGILHDVMDQLGLEGAAMQVNVSDPGAVLLPLGLPTAATIIAARCRDVGVDLPAGAFMGTIRKANGTPLTLPARVRAQYLETTIAPSGLVRRFPARFGDASDLGHFIVCGLPADAAITTRAYSGTDSSGVLEIKMPGNGLLLRDLYIGSAQRVTEAASSANERPRFSYKGSGRVKGVVRDTAGKPLVGARVSMPGNGAEGTTTGGGQFTLADLPGGSWMLEARAVGFQPQRVVVDILDSAEVQTAVSLPVVAPVVDTVKVRADRWSQQQAAFEQRRKMGFGYFLDENAIERRNARYTSDLLRSTPGVSIAPGMNGRDQVLMRGTGGSGQCVPTLFVDGMKTPVTNGVIDDVVRPVDVRAVEVYTGTGSVPLEFQGNSGCGSVVIWTGARRR